MQRDEKQKKWVKNVQMGLWVALILIQMAVVNSLEVRAETGMEVQPEDRGVQSEGTFLIRQVEKAVVYEKVEGGASLPETLDIQVKEAGKTVTAVCVMQEKEILREQWEDGFSFPVTFHTYDAEYYRLGDCLIPYNEEYPELDGCEEQLLELIGVAPEEYQIIALQWTGEPYEGADGELCRDALGSGRKLVRDYRVKYAGEVRIPMRRTVQQETVAESETEEAGSADEIAETTAPQVSIQKDADEATAKPDADSPLTFWQKITRTLLIVIGIGALLFFGGLLVLAFLWVVKKVWRWYTERKS